MTNPANADQKEYWSDAAGPKWLRHEVALDHTFQPVLDGVLQRADLQNGHAALDIGCGTGASTVQAAKAVGANGHVLGVDISESMLARARERGDTYETVTFALADATDYDFDPAKFDHLISRFGVMFFADPVAAFANMSKALKPGGKVTFASWGQIPENPFFTIAAKAARDTVGAPPKPDPDLPGPFAFRDPERVIGILRDCGLGQLACDTVTIDLTPLGNLDSLADLLSSIGPSDAAATHFDATPEQRVQLHEALKEGFAEFQTEKGLRIPAQINFYSAVKS